jgi:hypothetical protein
VCVGDEIEMYIELSWIDSLVHSYL